MKPDAATGVTVERETQLDAEDAARFAEIYEVSFPAEERNGTADLLDDIAAGERLCLLARRNGVVVGLAVVFHLQGPTVAFLEYLAVAPDDRDGGIGSMLLADLKAQLKAEDAVGILLEVEPPEKPGESERALCERRVNFYLRHGASVVKCAPNFRAPSLTRNDETIPFALLWLPLSDGAPPELAGTFLRRCVEAVLTQSYELDHDDPLIAEVLDDLAC